MNKYYTPEIEEFHIGFECELMCEDNGQWGTFIITANTNLSTFKEDIELETIRVKYLDREDIEELGFISEYANNMVKKTTWFKKDKLLIMALDNKGDVSNIGNSNIILIQELVLKNNGTGFYNTMFQGIIKNKSELKRLLKQLNIK